MTQEPTNLLIVFCGASAPLGSGHFQRLRASGVAPRRTPVPVAVRAAYHKAQRHAERRNMLQQWADYLTRLKEGAVFGLVQSQPEIDVPVGRNPGTRPDSETAEIFGEMDLVGDLTKTHVLREH